MKLIIANWKMNPATEAEAIALAKSSDIEGLVIAPPLKFLEVVKNNIKNAELGVQDLFSEDLKSYAGVKYAIIGHSDRRALGETNEIVAEKLKTALDFGLTPVLCVGESASERAADQTESVISHQLSVGLSLLNAERYTLHPKGDQPLVENASLVVAYEPLWAIGSKNPSTPQDTKKMLQYIHEIFVACRLSLDCITIYGGSVDASNAQDFLQEKEVDGVLVGGASLKSDQIIKIVEISKII